jgi:CubicO group peptidase (beta-lactamase class C family)
MVLLASSFPARAQSDPLEGLDAYAQKAMSQWKVPGLALAVVKDDRVVLAKGYGVLEVGKKELVDENTLFAIASNTKAFTATALGLLVQEGKIKWDDPVIDYLPGFALHDPVATKKITIRDLLCHRAGLGKWAGDLTWYASTYDTREVMRRIRFQEPAFDFRTGYGYTNLMYLAAGEIIPVVTKKSWSDFIKERFFKPLGMTRSNTSVKDLATTTNVARPHMIKDGRVTPIEYVDIDNVAPPGAINSSVKDLAQWLRLQLADGKLDGKQLVDAAIIKETRKSHTLVPFSDEARKRYPSAHFAAYGLGWGLMDYRGRLVIRHGGGLDGMFSFTGLMPEEKLGIVVLTNMEDHDLMTALVYHVFDAYLGVDFQDYSARFFKLHQEELKKRKKERQKTRGERVVGTKSSHAWTEYSGLYESRVYGRAEIKHRNGRLTLHLGAHPQIVGMISHWHHDTFLCKWKNSTFGESFIYFDFDDQMEIKQFRVKVRPEWIDTREYIFKRIK